MLQSYGSLHASSSTLWSPRDWGGVFISTGVVLDAFYDYSLFWILDYISTLKWLKGQFWQSDECTVDFYVPSILRRPIPIWRLAYNRWWALCVDQHCSVISAVLFVLVNKWIHHVLLVDFNFKEIRRWCIRRLWILVEQIYVFKSFGGHIYQPFSNDDDVFYVLAFRSRPGFILVIWSLVLRKHVQERSLYHWNQ